MLQSQGDPDGMMMEPPGMINPAKKKGRPTKKMEHFSDGARPIGQVSPAPRSGMEGMDMQESPRPPAQQERSSPMVQRSVGIRPGGRGRPMMHQPGFNLGPGMRPRGPAPQNYPKSSQSQPHHGNLDVKKLGLKLGGAISISTSDAENRENSNNSSSSQRPMPGRLFPSRNLLNCSNVL